MGILGSNLAVLISLANKFLVLVLSITVDFFIQSVGGCLCLAVEGIGWGWARREETSEGRVLLVGD